MIRQVSGDGRGDHAEFRRRVRDDPAGAEAAAYRQWMREVLMPIQRFFQRYHTVSGMIQLPQ